MRKIAKLLIMMSMLFVFTGCGKKADTKIWKSTTDPQELADFYASFKEANRPDNILSSYEEYTVVVTTSYAGDDYEVYY